MPTQAELCDAYLGVTPPESISLILTADPGDFSGTPEAHHIISNLKNKHIKPRSESVCGGLYLGTLMGVDALVVTTGETPTQDPARAGADTRTPLVHPTHTPRNTYGPTPPGAQKGGLRYRASRQPLPPPENPIPPSSHALTCSPSLATSPPPSPVVKLHHSNPCRTDL